MLDYIDLAIIPVFLLIFVRIIAFFVTMPLFSYRTIPNIFKIGLSFFLALVVFPSINLEEVVLNSYILLLLKEVIIGLFIGLIAYVILSAVKIAGGFVDFLMGFAIANVVDAQTATLSPTLVNCFYIIELLVLLWVNGY